MKFAAADRFLAGLALPLSALRSERSPACGEYPDLSGLGELAASWGLGLVQLLPVNDSGSQSSPYSALSAFALHPLYLRLGDLPEAAGAGAAPILAAAEALAGTHSGDERLSYGPYLESKLGLLQELFRLAYGESPQLEADPAFAAFITANPWVKAYAVFSELKRRNGGLPWWAWREHRDPGPGEIEALWEDPALRAGVRFRAWLQLRAEEQFSRAAASLSARGIELMGDIPILISEDSAEVWARRRVFRLGLKAGAPPDMYAELGQNWGFPLYDWEALEREDYAFWRERLRAADKFYSAYRIDHVLGFFRIWALEASQSSGYLGRFVPDASISRAELESLGLSAERIRWLSEPHLPTWRLLEAAGGDAGAAMEAQAALLDRIGEEELFLFKRRIRGEADIEAAAAAGLGGWGGPGLAPGLRDWLLRAYRDRVLLEFEPGRFVPAWSHASASAWPSLSEGERAGLEELFRRKRAEGEALWEATGRLLLGLLKESVPMLPCAEDLGAVPPCVPRVLGELGILGLRVLRWARRWEEAGQPYVELADYPRLSVACPSVHDSSSLREWWELEAERPRVWELASRALGRDLGPAPERLEPEQAGLLLEALAASGAGIVVYPIQDLLALSPSLRSADPRTERVNVPGTSGDWNWGYRLPVSLERLSAEEGLRLSLRRVAAARPGSSAGGRG